MHDHPDRLRTTGSPSDPGGSINVTATSFESLAAQKPLRFDPPQIELASNANSFVYWWGLLQYAFDVNDPRAFPPLSDPLPDADRERVARYVAKADDLARTTVLNADDEVTINIGEGGAFEEVIAKTSPVDAITGFATIFRQFYANEEPASFNGIQGILVRHAKAANDDRADARFDELRRWGIAVGKSRSQSAEKSALLKLIENGEAPPLSPHELATYPDPDAPERLISTYFYGEHIHWSDKGGHAQTLAARAQSPFDDAWYRMAFLRAAAGLAHLYLGYALVARAAASL